MFETKQWKHLQHTLPAVKRKSKLCIKITAFFILTSLFKLFMLSGCILGVWISSGVAHAISFQRENSPHTYPTHSLDYFWPVSCWPSHMFLIADRLRFDTNKVSNWRSEGCWDWARPSRVFGLALLSTKLWRRRRSAPRALYYTTWWEVGEGKQRESDRNKR